MKRLKIIYYLLHMTTLLITNSPLHTNYKKNITWMTLALLSLTLSHIRQMIIFNQKASQVVGERSFFFRKQKQPSLFDHSCLPIFVKMSLSNLPYSSNPVFKWTNQTVNFSRIRTRIIRQKASPLTNRPIFQARVVQLCHFISLSDFLLDKNVSIIFFAEVK